MPDQTIVAVPHQGVDVAVRPQDRSLRAVLDQPVHADISQQDGAGFETIEQRGVAHDREALADRLVHQPAVSQPRLGEDRADGRRRVEATTGAKLRLREVEHFHAGLEAAVAGCGGCAVGLLQHRAEAHGEIDESADMRQPLAFIGVEQRVGCTVLDDRGELPGEVGGVAHAGTHALAEERRRLVAGIARQQQAALAPAFLHHRMEGVDGGAFQPRVVRAEPARHHRPEDVGVGQPCRIVARHQHDLPAPAIAADVHDGHRSRRIAELDSIIG